MAKTKANQGPSRAIELGHLAADLSFATRALRACLRNENADFYKSHDVEAGGIAILCLIGLNPGISQKELASAIVLKKSAMTKVINDMEAHELIERRKVGDDKRFNALHLTRKGARRYENMISDMVARQERLLAPLSQAERSMFFDMIWRLIGQFNGGLEDD